MLFVGVALFAYYEPMRSGSEPEIFGQDSNYIYPAWIVTELPAGLRGLILAGIFRGRHLQPRLNPGRPLANDPFPFP